MFFDDKFKSPVTPTSLILSTYFIPCLVIVVIIIIIIIVVVVVVVVVVSCHTNTNTNPL